METFYRLVYKNCPNESLYEKYPHNRYTSGWYKSHKLLKELPLIEKNRGFGDIRVAQRGCGSPVSVIQDIPFHLLKGELEKEIRHLDMINNLSLGCMIHNVSTEKNYIFISKNKDGNIKCVDINLSTRKLGDRLDIAIIDERNIEKDWL